MAISIKTQKMLWGRAASRCAICRAELVMDSSETDDPSVVGEACHIVGQKVEGPRGESMLLPEQRDKFANLILLCNIHHKQVDDQVRDFPVERLTKIKKDHEEWVKTTLGVDPQHQRDDEIYADYVDTWANDIRLSEWTNWTSALLSHGQPSLSADMKERLEKIRPWILSRVWPGRYANLEAALTNFRVVAQDLMEVFDAHADKLDSYTWKTNKFYQIEEWNPQLYKALSEQFEYHVGLVEDLTLELTRAANHVCQAIRDELMASYRIKEGVLLVQAGPYMDFSWKTYRIEYRMDERHSRPYPGLERFKEIRFTRDIWFGQKPLD